MPPEYLLLHQVGPARERKNLDLGLKTLISSSEFHFNSCERLALRDVQLYDLPTLYTARVESAQLTRLDSENYLTLRKKVLADLDYRQEKLFRAPSNDLLWSLAERFQIDRARRSLVRGTYQQVSSHCYDVVVHDYAILLNFHEKPLLSDDVVKKIMKLQALYDEQEQLLITMFNTQRYWDLKESQRAIRAAIRQLRDDDLAEKMG